MFPPSPTDRPIDLGIEATCRHLKTLVLSTLLVCFSKVEHEFLPTMLKCAVVMQHFNPRNSGMDPETGSCLEKNLLVIKVKIRL